MLETIPAISLLQPWASLVAEGYKTVETRSWRTNHRGLVAIHASKTVPRDVRDDRELLDLAVAKLGKFALTGTLSNVSGVSLPLGAVLAMAELVDCVRTEHVRFLSDAEIDWAPSCRWAVGSSLVPGDEGRRLFVSESERPFGNYQPRRWAWLLENIRPLTEPIIAKGSLQIWPWTPPEGWVLP